ncbi:LysR family transcriptional regulator [Marinospirillum perlucidum]|uniref:LysR family transcriptional regulator n=1 Tax=Marinospirillum perlucidum TaxID=1982602 RepID=UPI000DF29FBB|nr:LysR family transcriptional regulator [Marinospirillum perlucidum]
MDQLKAIHYFIAVAEEGSFTAAARRFRLPPSSISRRVADLEKHLGVQLLLRSTRLVRLTEMGQIYLQTIKPLTQQLAATHEKLSSYQRQPSGLLKISAMVTFGEQLLLPLLDRFNQQYPQIQLDVHLTDTLSALDYDDLDLAIRGGTAPNTRVLAHRLMDNHFYPVAAPAYLETAGYPKTARELAQHRGLYYRTPQGPTPWLAYLDGQWVDVSGPRVAVSNHTPWLLQKALAGEGILMLPRWASAHLIQRGELLPLQFSDPVRISRSPSNEVYLLYQPQRFEVPKIRVAVEFILQEMQKLEVRLGL